MCRSFAIELLLKFFLVIEHPEAKTLAELKARGVDLHGHPYSDLFDRINAPHKDLIAATHSNRTGEQVIWSPENGHHEDYYLDLVEDV